MAVSTDSRLLPGQVSLGERSSEQNNSLIVIDSSGVRTHKDERSNEAGTVMIDEQSDYRRADKSKG
jgi:hypothetical protein